MAEKRLLRDEFSPVDKAKIFNSICATDFAKAFEEKRVGFLMFEITNLCTGSCLYCYSSSTAEDNVIMPKETVFRVIDELKDMGIDLICWSGGDPLTHPDWYEIMSYTAEKGLVNGLLPNPMSLTQKVSKKLCDLKVEPIFIHIDSIVQDIYNKVHRNPKTLEKKMQGYRNLLEAGFSPKKICGVITVTKPVISSVNETLDWFFDEMGATFVCYDVLRAAGFGDLYKEWEPGVSDLKLVYDNRANKFDDEVLRRCGPLEAGSAFCKTYFALRFDGEVRPCAFLLDHKVGNIYEESLASIFEKNRKLLTFDFKIKGYCGEECDSRDVCFGCRANAYFYTGDVEGSDPKCYRNPASKEFVY